MIRLLLASLLLLPASAPRANARVLQRVAASRLVDAARAQLDAKLGQERTAAHVTVVGKPDDILLQSGTVSLRLRPLQGRWPRARVGVPVDVAVDGQVVQSATVWFALDVHQQVLGYASDAMAGTLADALKLVPTEADVAAVQGDLVVKPDQLDNMRLRHAVVAGTVVVREDFEPVPDVDNQQRVQVRVDFGAIRMQAKGTAASRGNRDELISVLVDDAEAPVRARVIAKGVVEVVQ